MFVLRPDSEVIDPGSDAETTVVLPSQGIGGPDGGALLCPTRLLHSVTLVNAGLEDMPRTATSKTVSRGGKVQVKFVVPVTTGGYSARLENSAEIPIWNFLAVGWCHDTV